MEGINKSEFEAAKNYIQKMLTQEVSKIEITDKIPTNSDAPDSNIAFNGKLSILFVDMRDSTELTNKLGSEKMVKVYRSFIRCVIQSIRYSGGESRQIIGDGVMGVFQDDKSDKDKGKTSSSEEKAILAARYIITMVDYCLNPLLCKYLGGLSIGCGVGIGTGDILAVKVGMRGKEIDDSVENETDIVWSGQTTNYANRYCSLAKAGEIFIDKDTYENVYIENDKIWKSVKRNKGGKVFEGYISKSNYLPISKELEDAKIKPLPYVAKTNKKSVSSTSIDEIVNKAIIQTEKMYNDLHEQANEIKNKNRRIEKLENKLEETNKKLTFNLQKGHDFLNSLLMKAHIVDVKDEFFWEEIINNYCDFMQQNYDDAQYKNEIALYGDCITEIYYKLHNYKKAYNALIFSLKYVDDIDDLSLDKSMISDIIKRVDGYDSFKRIMTKRMSESNEAKTLYDDVMKELNKVKD